MTADVAVDQPVEEPPQRRQMELLGRCRQLQALEVFADVAGADAREFQAALLDPGEEFPHGVHVVLAGVGVGDLGLEEFLPGELGGLAGGLDDRRGVAGGDRFVRSDQFAGLGPVVDGDLILRIGHPGCPPCSRYSARQRALSSAKIGRGRGCIRGFLGPPDAGRFTLLPRLRQRRIEGRQRLGTRSPDRQRRRE